MKLLECLEAGHEAKDLTEEKVDEVLCEYKASDRYRADIVASVEKNRNDFIAKFKKKKEFVALENQMIQQYMAEYINDRIDVTRQVLSDDTEHKIKSRRRLARANLIGLSLDLLISIPIAQFDLWDELFKLFPYAPKYYSSVPSMPPLKSTEPLIRPFTTETEIVHTPAPGPSPMGVLYGVQANDIMVSPEEYFDVFNLSENIVIAINDGQIGFSRVTPLLELLDATDIVFDHLMVTVMLTDCATGINTLYIAQYNQAEILPVDNYKSYVVKLGGFQSVGQLPLENMIRDDVEYKFMGTETVGFTDWYCISDNLSIGGFYVYRPDEPDRPCEGFPMMQPLAFGECAPIWDDKTPFSGVSVHVSNIAAPPIQNRLGK